MRRAARIWPLIALGIFICIVAAFAFSPRPQTALARGEVVESRMLGSLRTRVFLAVDVRLEDDQIVTAARGRRQALTPGETVEVEITEYDTPWRWRTYRIVRRVEAPPD